MSVEDTLAERGKRYGDFTDHAAVCQRIKLAMIAGAARWTRLPDTHKQALEVIADKIARILTGDPNYADNWHDIQGYAKLVEDRLPKEPSAAMFDSASLVDDCTVRSFLFTPSPPSEDVYAEFAARVGAAPGYELLIKCEECKTVSRGGRLHVCTCSQLTAPEEYKAEAQVAFDEAAELSEALARQVSAGKIDIGFDWGSAVAEEEALIEVEEEPAAAMDDDSPRMQAIGQNGNGGEHYEDPFAAAPEWAKYKAQQEHGAWEFYEDEPTNERGFWRHELRGVRSGEVGERNPNWRGSLITRT